MEEKTEHNTYQGISFLRVDVLMVLNMRHASLDLHHIPTPSSENFSSHLVVQCFALPRLASTWNLESMSMRAGPRPSQHPSDEFGPEQFSSVPFHSSPENSLVLINLSAISRYPLSRRHFSFVVHRHAILAHSTSQISRSPMPWSQWGPPICRWFNSDLVPMWWPVATHGQRYVRPSSTAVTWPSPVRVLDFNPYHIRRVAANLACGNAKPTPTWNLVKRTKRFGKKLLRQKKKVTSGSGPQRVVLSEDGDGFMSYGVFEDDVGSTLPYIECVSRDVFEYDGVLIDEERLVALRVCSVFS